MIWVLIHRIRGELFFSAKGLLASGYCWCLGDGLTIKVFYEPWLGDNFCIDSIPLSGLENLRVNQLFSIDEMARNVDFMEGILTPIDVNV